MYVDTCSDVVASPNEVTWIGCEVCGLPVGTPSLQGASGASEKIFAESFTRCDSGAHWFDVSV